MENLRTKMKEDYKVANVYTMMIGNPDSQNSRHTPSFILYKPADPKATKLPCVVDTKSCKG
eukprot:4806921-Karenia_brevis.AAC.1